MKASQQAIERGVKDCVFIDYKRRSGHFDVTTVASIKEITEKVDFGAPHASSAMCIHNKAALGKYSQRFSFHIFYASA